MEDINIDIIKKKSLSGVIALSSRTFILQIIAFSATFLLTIFLSPPVFGIFYVVSAIISFLGYFSDIGLAAALIQKKEALSHEDLRTTFTIQQLLVGIAVIVSLVFAPHVGSFYRLDASGVWLFRALVISFFLSSLKTIPSVLLERALDFQKLVLPQILETLSFYIVAVVLAWKGYGITSFTFAVIARGIIGLAAIYIVSPWKISLGLSKVVARKLLRFGIPFQLNSFLALVKDDLLTVVLGKMLPFSEVGYIGWAKKWAEVPLRLIMDSVIRVTFPAFSRLQHDKELLGKAIEKALFGLSLTIFPISIGLLYYVGQLVHTIPRYGKWEPAIMSFYLFAIASAIASLSTPLTNALNAVGKIKTTLYLMVFWTSSTWILTIFFVRLIGFNGVSLSLLLITSTIILVVALTKRIAAFSFWANIRVPLIAAVAQAIVYQLLRFVFPAGFAWFILSGSLGVILYGGIAWVFERSRIEHLLRQLPIWKR